MSALRSPSIVKSILRRARKLKAFALQLLLALSVSLLLTGLDLQFYEAFSYDFRVSTKPASPVSGLVKTVAVDSATIKDLGRELEWQDLNRLLERIGPARPRAIVLTFNPKDLPASPVAQKEFATLAQDFPLLIASDELPAPGDKLTLPPPLENLKLVPAPPTWDSKIFAKDGVTRRFIFDFLGEPLLHAQLASEVTGLSPDDVHGLFRFKRTRQAYIDYHPPGTYRSESLIKILNGQVIAEEFKDKIVFVGVDLESSLSDYIKTPFSRDVTAMSLLEMHANIMDTLLLNRSPRQPHRDLVFILTFLLACATFYLVMFARPLRGLIYLALLVCGYALVSWLLLAFTNFILPMATPLIGLSICYYFLIPYRLIIENRRSWEYYQRNQLLTQVEELKTNFMKMMSHDLKTPLARIQGMADIIKKEESGLSGEAKNAVRSIFQSTEELSKFISSILSLSRIESKEIKLHRRSKDINHLLSEVVQNCDYLAQKKSIKILTEFEPLFSVRIDEDLLRQVFTNLVENAIKYSPENSSILISTEEEAGRLLVQVADQGMGILPEEAPRIFDKFFRSTEAKDVKGSGLGLYLSKYFVELHAGRISVESEWGRGSTFSVEIPVLPDDDFENKGVIHA